MLVPYSWLLDYVDPGIAAEQLADRFNLSGIEVGSVEAFADPLPGVIAARVEELASHPERSNLTLVTVNNGLERLKILCGADNMKAGDVVALALPGSVLPGGRRIEKAVLHGFESEGMLCSATELGLDLGSADDILILDPGTEPGVALEDILSFSDPILELELTPNRADCLGLLGVAYEVAALTGTSVKLPAVKPREAAQSIEDCVSIEVVDTAMCPRYTARVIRGVKIGKAPLWMQVRLLKAGIRPISNVVDATNYVMWETGQPLHAFDLGQLKSGRVLVRRAERGEKLVTLDGVERSLDPEALLITDGKVPIGLAGVMGGENTEINPATDSVLLEAASFSQTSIRRTARRFNLPSEASQRFEKGINPEAVLMAQNRAAKLIAELAGGEVLAGVVDTNPVLPEKIIVPVNCNRISRVVGLDFSAQKVGALLSRLGFGVDGGDGPELSVTVPLRRPDVAIEEDIIEEVARLNGYDQIPATLPHGKALQNRENDNQRLERTVRDTVVALGYYETISYSFINPVLLRKMRLDPADPRLCAIPLQNPFSEEQGVMRTTLIPGLLKSLKHNFSHRELDCQLFEIGKVYMAESLPLLNLPQESLKLSMAVSGSIPGATWAQKSLPVDFFTLKGALEALFARLGVDRVDYREGEEPYTHPTRTATIMAGAEKVGLIGQLHPDVAEDFELSTAVFICELDCAVLFRHARKELRVSGLPRYPAANRDLALVVPRELSAVELEDTIHRAGAGLTDKVTLFDLYEGPQVPEGKRSLAYAVSFRREDGTLTDEEVNGTLDRIKSALAAIGASLRSQG